VIRFVGQIAAFHAGFGAMRHAARDCVAPTHAISSRTRALQFVLVDTQAPQGGAKAP
jgi:hypothetical protein